jgi:hypothetical protein
MYDDEPINTLEELMSHICYDWPDSTYPKGQPRIDKSLQYEEDFLDDMFSYSINKTYIYPSLTIEENGEVTGEFYLEYKTSRHKMTREVYEKFKMFYDLLYN